VSGLNYDLGKRGRAALVAALPWVRMAGAARRGSSHNLAGQAQPYFDTPVGGGSTGLLRALRTDEAFRKEVAAGDIIAISTGPNDGGDIFDVIQGGKCGGADDTACVDALNRKWHRDFDAILSEIEKLRAGHPTVIRLVNAANAFNDPSFSPATLRGFDAYFQAPSVATLRPRASSRPDGRRRVIRRIAAPLPARRDRAR
jgi:hypothetical protein